MNFLSQPKPKFIAGKEKEFSIRKLKETMEELVYKNIGTVNRGKRVQVEKC